MSGFDPTNTFEAIEQILMKLQKQNAPIYSKVAIWGVGVFGISGAARNKQIKR